MAYEELDPHDALGPRQLTPYSSDDALKQWCFKSMMLKACSIGAPDSLIPLLPAFFIEFVLIRADGTDESEPFEVYVGPEDLGDLGAMCNQALGRCVQEIANEREILAVDLARDMKDFR